MRYSFTIWFALFLSVARSTTWGQAADTNLWTFIAEERVGTPSFGPDGAVYFAADRGLVCLNRDGSSRWRYEEESPILGIPSVGDDGTVYCGIYNGDFGAFTNGGAKWKFKAGGHVFAPPAVGRDGTIYFTSADWKMYALTPDGEKKWSREIFCNAGASPAIGSDGTIYAVGENDLIALAPEDGQIRWRSSANGQASTSPAIGADGTIYFGAYGKELRACSPDGTNLWKFTTAEPFGSASPVVGSDGTIFAPAGRTLYALNPNGSKKWHFTAPSPIESTPCIAADGTIYFNSYEREFYALTSAGQVKWTHYTEYRVNDSPALDKDGMLLIPQFLSLKAINSDTGLDAGPWPTLQQSPQRIGRAFLQPSVTLVTPTSRQDLAVGDSVLLSAEASSPNGAIARVEFWTGTTKIGSVSNAPYVFHWTNAPAGIHFVYARAFDQLGANAASSQMQVNFTPDGTVLIFTLQPASQVLSNGATLHLTADVFGSAPFAFQWLKDGAAIPVATNNHLIITNVTRADSAYYQVVATNSAGRTASTDAVISVIQPHEVKWIAENIGSAFSPAISQGTRIIVGAGNAIQAIGPSGQFLWNSFIGEIAAAPSIGLDGSIYVSTRDGKFHAIAGDGTLRWTNPTNGWNEGTAAIGTHGTIYTAGDTNLHAYNLDGEMLWTVSLLGTAYSSPSIGADGTIFVGTLARFLDDQRRFSSWFSAIAPDGGVKWRREFTNNIVSSAGIDADGSVIFGVTDGRIYRYSSEGEKVWEFRGDGPITGSAVIGVDGTIYVGGEGERVNGQTRGRLYALNPFGILKWKYAFPLGVSGAPALAADGTIYAGSRAGFVALNPNGTVKYEYKTNAQIPGSPVIGFDGTVYFASSDHKLHALHGDSPLQRSAWPMFQRDVKHTGNAGAPFDSDTFFYPFSSNSFDDQVRRISADGENVFVGGDFKIAGGVPAHRIARWNGLEWSSLGSGLDDRVQAIAIGGTNLYAGGFFRRAGDTNANFVARWDGQQWHALGDGFREYIYDLEIINGELYSAGGFYISENRPGSCVNIWDGEQWRPLGDNLNGTVFDILPDGTNIFIAGGGNLWKIDEPVSSVAQWNGSRWVSVGNIFGYAATIAKYRGTLYVGGERLESVGPNVTFGGMAKWTGSRWEGVGGLLNAHVASLVSDGDYLYAGGTFTNIAGTQAFRIARFDGTNWTAFGPGVSGSLPRASSTVNSILPMGEELMIGGVFTQAGGKRDIFHFAQWNGSQWNSVGPLLHFVDGRFSLTLSDALGQSYGIEASADLLEWVRVASYTNVTEALQFVDQNSTNSTQRFYRAVSP